MGIDSEGRLAKQLDSLWNSGEYGYNLTTQKTSFFDQEVKVSSQQGETSLIYSNQKMNNSSGSHPSVARDEWSYSFTDAFKFPVLTVYIIIVVVAVIGNIMVCFAILVDKSLRSNPTTILLFSLAFSDLLTVTTVTPLQTEEFFLRGTWFYGKTMCKLWSTVFYIAVPTSILTLLVLSVDRYNHLTDPLNRFRKTRFMTRKKAMMINCLIWFYTVLFASIPYTDWGDFHYESFAYDKRCWFPYINSYTTVTSFLNFLLPLLITCGIYIKIYRIASVRNKNVTTARRCECGKLTFTQETNNYIGNLKAAKTISMFVGVSFFCWVPYSTFIIINCVCIHCRQHIPPETYPFLLMLGYLSSALNPFLFAFRSKSFKFIYSKMLRSIMVLKPKPSPDSRRVSSISQMTLASEIPCSMEEGIILQAVQSRPLTLNFQNCWLAFFFSDIYTH